MFLRMDMEPFFKEMETAFGKSGRCGNRVNLDDVQVDETKWEYRLDLSDYPTKPTDIQINLKNEMLTLSGKSEVTSDKGGFSVFSTHVWSKEIQLPNKLKKATIKAKLNDQNIMMLTGEMDSADTEIDIEMTPELD